MSIALFLNGSRNLRSIAVGAFLTTALLAASSVPASAWDVTIAWDPNREPELDGYTLYYAKHAPGPPYDYVGDLPVDSLKDPSQPVASVTNLEKHVNYYFALTAYDKLGNESYFSRQLCVRADETIYECAMPADSASAGLGGSGGSGSSAGCFILSARDCKADAKSTSLPLYLLALATPFASIIATALSRRN